MVRESVNPERDEETRRHRERTTKSREGSDAREHLERLGSKEKAVAYSDMQRRIEAGEDEDTAPARAAQDVDRGDPDVKQQVEKAHERGRPEGET